MKIDLTQKEYETLLDMMEIAHWVLFTYSAEEEPNKETYKELGKKMLSLANSCERNSGADSDEANKSCYRKNEFSDQVEKFIDEFETENFFNQLAIQLTTRDLVDMEGLEKLRNMAPEERYEKFESLQNIYLDEFEQNGIENIQIKI